MRHFEKGTRSVAARNCCYLLRLLLVSSVFLGSLATDGAQLRLSKTLCGRWDVVYQNWTIDDSPLAALYPLSSFEVASDPKLGGLDRVTSLYAANALRGPTHGGYPVGNISSVDAGTQAFRLVYAVMACCDTYDRGGVVLQLRLMSWGGMFTIGDTGACPVPSGWEYVPEGFVIGGLLTRSLAENDRIHQLQFVFVSSDVLQAKTRAFPPSPPPRSPAPPPPSPLPPAPSPPPAPPSPYPPTSCRSYPGYSAQPDVDVVGGDLNLNILHTDDVAAKCSSNALCIGFNSQGRAKAALSPIASQDVSQHVCLYTKLPPPPPSAPPPSHPPLPPPRPPLRPPHPPAPSPAPVAFALTVCKAYPGYSAQPDVDHTGDDLHRDWDYSSLGLAAWACAADPSCQGFNSDGWLKKLASPNSAVPASKRFCLYAKLPQPPSPSPATSEASRGKGVTHAVAVAVQWTGISLGLVVLVAVVVIFRKRCCKRHRLNQLASRQPPSNAPWPGTPAEVVVGHPVAPPADVQMGTYYMPSWMGQQPQAEDNGGIAAAAADVPPHPDAGKDIEAGPATAPVLSGKEDGRRRDDSGSSPTGPQARLDSAQAPSVDLVAGAGEGAGVWRRHREARGDASTSNATLSHTPQEFEAATGEHVASTPANASVLGGHGLATPRRRPDSGNAV